MAMAAGEVTQKPLDLHYRAAWKAANVCSDKRPSAKRQNTVRCFDILPLLQSEAVAAAVVVNPTTRTERIMNNPTTDEVLSHLALGGQVFARIASRDHEIKGHDDGHWLLVDSAGENPFRLPDSNQRMEITLVPLLWYPSDGGTQVNLVECSQHTIQPPGGEFTAIVSREYLEKFIGAGATCCIGVDWCEPLPVDDGEFDGEVIDCEYCYIRGEYHGTIQCEKCFETVVSGEKCSCGVRWSIDVYAFGEKDDD